MERAELVPPGLDCDRCRIAPVEQRGENARRVSRWGDLSVGVLLLTWVFLVCARIEADPGVGHAPHFSDDPPIDIRAEPEAPVVPPQLIEEQRGFVHGESPSQLRVGFYDSDRNQFILARSGDSDPVPFEL